MPDSEGSEVEQHPCPKCGAVWPTHMKMLGHVGGKHGSLQWGKKARGHIEHGTYKGYLKHQRHDVPFDTCPEGRSCRRANTEYKRRRRLHSKTWKARKRP